MTRDDPPMFEEDLTVDRLAQLLRDAEKAHAEYEKSLENPDDDWPTWYAAYIVDRLRVKL
jgi:hypothetical protein